MAQSITQYLVRNAKDWLTSKEVQANALRLYTERMMHHAWEVVHGEFNAPAFLIMRTPMFTTNDIVRVSVSSVVFPGEEDLSVDSVQIFRVLTKPRSNFVTLWCFSPHPDHKKRGRWFRVQGIQKDKLDPFLLYWLKHSGKEGMDAYSFKELKTGEFLCVQ